MALPEVKIHCFTLAIRESRHGKKGKKDDFLAFGLLPSDSDEDSDGSETNDFVQIFHDYVAFLDGEFYVNRKNNLAFTIPISDLLIASHQRTISGVVKGGRSGSSKDVSLKDQANDEPDFVITTNHVDHQSFAFKFYLPKDSPTGILLVSSFTTFSVADLMVSHLKKFFSDEYNLILNVERFAPREVLDNLEDEAKVAEIKIKKHSIPADQADSIFGLGFVASDLTIEVKISGLQPFSKKVIQAMSGMRTNDGVSFLTTPVLDSLGLKPNERDIDIVYKREGKQFTAKSKNNFEVKPHFYVPSSDIKYDEDLNLPILSSVLEYMTDLLDTIKVDLQI